MKRYFLIAYSHSSINGFGYGNIGYKSEKGFPLNNEKIKKEITNHESKYNLSSIVIINIFEFNNEKDYLDFWGK